MPQPNEAIRLFTYARWANELMFDACETVSVEALTRETGSSFGSVFGTLDHLYGADWIWLERWSGRSPTAFPPRGRFASVAEFRAAFGAQQDARDAYVNGLTSADLTGTLRYLNTRGEPQAFNLGAVVFHVANHSTYHRGQVMQSVRQLGGTVKSSDFLYWPGFDG
jgi:uncharacterized damage-inducible protein DinB